MDGYHVVLHGKPRLRAIQPAFLDFTVTSPSGKPAQFQTWFGALAHAIFFRTGTLDYFHTHVCAPGATGCSSVFGAARVTPFCQGWHLRDELIPPGVNTTPTLVFLDFSGLSGVAPSAFATGSVTGKSGRL